MNLEGSFGGCGFFGRIVASMVGIVLSGAALASDVWVSCSACSEQEAKNSASAALPAPGSYWGGSVDIVYVVDPINRVARKYEVITAVEPGLTERWTTELQVESGVLSSLNSFWIQTASIGELEIPADRSPSAVDYMVNPYHRGLVGWWLDGGAQGWIAQINSALFTANVSTSQALAAMGADRGPLILNLRFSNGSTLKVQVTMGQNAITSSPTIVEIAVVPDSAFNGDGSPLPTQLSGLSNYDVFNPSPSLIEALLRLSGAYGVPVSYVCSGGVAGSRWRCTANGNCELIQPC